MADNYQKQYTVPIRLKYVADDTHNFKPLPNPVGNYPYSLNIETVMGKKETHKFDQSMTFQVVGDTGSLRPSAFQSVLASSIKRHLQENEERPAFLYHVGDIVYNHGEASEYHRQFLTHYEDYDAPIFAIPGNHDGEINLNVAPYHSLDAFVQVFCSEKPGTIPFGQGSKRLTGTQPHVYWTLETPLARFIGLYGNVNKHGMIDDQQRDWFIQELQRAKSSPGQQALIVCIHHAPFSADTNHGSSLRMIEFLDHAFQQADILPDAVFSGHVHNYQRFNRSYSQTKQVPYIVTGAGGYVDLHAIALHDDPAVSRLPSHIDNVRLEAYCDKYFGFLSVQLRRTSDGIALSGKYYALTDDAAKDQIPVCMDEFEQLIVQDTK